MTTNPDIAAVVSIMQRFDVRSELPLPIRSSIV